LQMQRADVARNHRDGPRWDHNMPVTVWGILVRIPFIGPRIERRWMPDSAERDLHQQIVQERLMAPAQAEADPPPETVRPDD